MADASLQKSDSSRLFGLMFSAEPKRKNYMESVAASRKVSSLYLFYK